ncbi:hypothetical protein PPERSA_02790 [Pseudocohnilembus persalinus]|uniref:NAD-dependent epimerase/dehydratase domain-containing protein n=1 Tax=Pseudocohnilembus persalinus TaxID=266149 RepID=A0A0V0QM54_PSEPJ|nr:hypothetical protein PPERSA_02790 [Pseudocohnilembus persalinus]|eukprot:KRX03411.1 hypothetical protein PPERSA_02790 [Pseudocohnilembus persalinus]
MLSTKAQLRLTKNFANLLKYSNSSAANRPTELFFSDQGYRQTNSGIRATIFGATGFVGPYVGAVLGYIGSDLNFPHCHQYNYDDAVKELKLCAVSGQSYLMKHFDFDNEEMLDRAIENSNVVINLCGPRKQVKKLGDAEYVNIDISRKIAKACAKNPNVIRLIHFSAAGAEPDSASIDLSTKYFGEQEVKQHFPNATILRPTTIYGMNDYFVRLWYTERDYFYHYNVVTDDCTAKRQPILVNDVAQAVLNALKLPETAGKTYDLGGPHTYSRLEIFETLHNIIGRPPKLAYVPFSFASTVAKNFHNWENFNLDTMVKNQLDLVCNPNNGNINDLYIQPVSFPNGVEQFIHDIKAKYEKSRDLNER